MKRYVLTSLVPPLLPRLVKIKEWVNSHDPQATVIPFSGTLELKVCVCVYSCLYDHIHK